jgi:hypothetical protein
MYELTDSFGHDEMETDVHEYEDTIGSSIEIRPDIQFRLDANKYNL